MHNNTENVTAASVPTLSKLTESIALTILP